MDETYRQENQQVWKLAAKLVSMDSSDPGAYEGEIGNWIYQWLDNCIKTYGGAVAGGTSGAL